MGIRSVGEMRIRRPAEISVPEENPFLEDALGRQPFAEALTSLVSATQSAYVLNLEARWGEGKTTFLRMWLAHLKQQGIPSLYFNAWESDFSQDPLIALIGELTSSMAIAQAEDSSLASLQVEKVRSIGLKLVRQAIPAAVKLATAGLLDLSDVTEATLGDLGEKMAESQVAAYEEGKKSLQSFREELEKFASSLGKAEDIPLVLVIDELDRCRPDYAVRMLEVVKHFFSVPGIFFVVATDSQQLASSVRHIYGLDSSAAGYLRRFFDVTLSLPEVKPLGFVRAQIGRFRIDDFLKDRTHSELRHDRSHLESAFMSLFKAADCTLRDQEKCFSLLSVAVRSIRNNQFFHPLFLCTLIVLRIKNPELYRSYIRGKSPAEDIVKFFSSTDAGMSFFSSEGNYSAPIEAFLRIAPKDRYQWSDVKSELFASSEEQGKSPSEKARAIRVARIIDDLGVRQSPPSLAHITAMIDLVSPVVDDDD